MVDVIITNPADAHPGVCNSGVADQHELQHYFADNEVQIGIFYYRHLLLNR